MGRRRWCSGSFRFRFSGWTLARKDSYPAANDGEILAAGLVVVQFGKEASQNARLLRPKVRDASRGSPRSPSASLRAGFRRAKNACSRMTIKLHHYGRSARVAVRSRVMLGFCNFRNTKPERTVVRADMVKRR